MANTTFADIYFSMRASSDHITPFLGTPTVLLRAPGGTWFTPAGTVSSLNNGWYRITANADDQAVAGPYLLHATATGADPTDVAVWVGDYGWYDQGSSEQPVPFWVALTETGLAATGVSPSLQLRKPGNSWRAAQGPIAEVGYGWYELTPTAGDLDVPGQVLLQATATDCATTLDSVYVYPKLDATPLGRWSVFGRHTFGGEGARFGQSLDEPELLSQAYYGSITPPES